MDTRAHNLRLGDIVRRGGTEQRVTQLSLEYGPGDRHPSCVLVKYVDEFGTFTSYSYHWADVLHVDDNARRIPR